MSNTLSDADIEALAQQHLKAFAQFTGAGEVWFEGEINFARAIEAEVRKQDDALILQLVDALERSSPHTDATYAWKSEDFVIKRSAAITAARARLGEKT